MAKPETNRRRNTRTCANLTVLTIVGQFPWVSKAAASSKKAESLDNRSVAIALPVAGYRRFMFFNRFDVDRQEDGFVQIHLGMVNKANVLLDCYSTVMSEADLSVLKQTTMDYLGRQVALVEAPPPWKAPGVAKVEIANHFVMAQQGIAAETVFYSFSYWSVVEQAKKMAMGEPGEAGVIAEGLALLRSPLGVQQHLIRALFPVEAPLLPAQ